MIEQFISGRKFLVAFLTSISIHFQNDVFLDANNKLIKILITLFLYNWTLKLTQVEQKTRFMGSCFSKNFVSNEAISGQDKESVQIMMHLNLSAADINKLFKVFKQIDIDGSNAIKPEEMFSL